MTEAEWVACEEPERMFSHAADIASNRKARLFVCAECRLRWHLLYHERSRTAVEVAERFADGMAEPEEMFDAGWCAEAPTFGHDFCDGWREFVTDDRTPPEIEQLVVMGVLSPNDFAVIETPAVDELVGDVKEATQFAYKTTLSDLRVRLRSYGRPELFGAVRWSGAWLVRDIFGNPFRPVAFSPEWRTDTAVALAAQMYECRDFSAMPILADALQDAGCDSADILDHCRGAGPHVRGCWVVDLVLGKE
jgi:hypothetical protein